jgi:hypothetical protein
VTGRWELAVELVLVIVDYGKNYWKVRLAAACSCNIEHEEYV